MGEILGSAELETGVDLAGLDAGLVRAEARVARSVAVMQGMLDSVEARADLTSSAMDAAAAKLAAAAVPSSGGPAGSSTSNQTIRNGGNEVWGVRGPVHAGSLTNPIVTVLAASKFFPMGSYGAGIGDSNTTDEQNGDSGFATAADMAALTAAVGDLARNANPVNALATAGSQGMAEPGGAERTVVTLNRENGDALGRAATAMESMAAQSRVSGQDQRALLSALRSSGADDQEIAVVRARMKSGTRGAAGTADQEAAADAALLAAMDRLADSDSGAADRIAAALAATDRITADAQLLADAAAARGSLPQGTSNSTGGSFAYTVPSGSGGRGGGGFVPPVALGGGGGGGGNRRVDVFYHASGDGGEGGGAAGGASSSLIRNVLWGPGHRNIWTLGLPLASAGTAASFAGLGPEHLLMTGLGIAGSAGTAVAGGGLLALGGAGVMGAGMAADASGLGQAAGDTKNVWTVLNQYQTAQQALAKQLPKTAAAQAALNTQLAGFAPVARAAVTQAALTGTQFHWMYDQVTGPGEATGANILNQAIQVAEKFLPSLGQSTTTDMHIIQGGLQPLFAWLGGPEGLGIFQNLEHEFTQNLPSSLGALTNGLEGVLRVMNIASGYTGGFVQHIDDLFKKLNGMSDPQIERVVGRLIGDFKVWEQFVKALGTDIVRLFSSDVGTGRSIIVTLTDMLKKLGDWEESVSGRQDLMTIFTVHKNEVQALLKILPLLLDPLGKLYLTVAPAATTAFTDLATAIADVAKAIESLPGGSWVLAIGLLASKLGLTATLLGGGAGAAGGVVTGGATAATDAEAGAGGATATGLLPKLLGMLGRSGPGTAITGGVEDATLGAAGVAEGAGAEGLAGLLAGGGAALAPLVGAVVPLAVTALGAYGAYKLITAITGGSAQPHTSYTAGGLENELRSGKPGVHVLSLPAVKGAKPPSEANGPYGKNAGLLPGSPTMFTLADIANTKQAKDALQQWYDTAKSSVSVSKLNVTQLAAMAREGDRLAQIFPKDAQLIDKLNAPIKSTFASLNNVIQLMLARWKGDATTGLAELKGVFTSNLELIADKVGLSSHEGEKMWKTNLDQMVKDVTDGMLKGKIATQSGMDAINEVTTAGVKGQAITWQQQSSLVLSSITALYRAGKIPASQYYSDLDQITRQGTQKAADDASTQMQAQILNTKNLFQHGNDGFVVSQQDLNAQLHQIRADGNTQAGKDMTAWVTTLMSEMSAGGDVSVQGANAILGPLNAALKELGQKPVTLVSLQNSAAGPAIGSGLPSLPGTLGAAVSLPGSSGAASGALYQVGQPGAGGRDTVPLNVAGIPVMVGSGEQVAVFNRHQQPIVNAALSMLGYDGMSGLFSSVNTPNYLARGGTIGTPSAVGGGVQGSLLNAAFSKLAKSANSDLTKKSRSGGTAPGGARHGAGTSAGGEFNAGQLAALWVAAGGPPNVAHLMAAIALAESGGNPTAENPSGASGLWQILGVPFAGNVFNPSTNARMAVAKYLSQGLGAWVTYTSGAYKQFYAGGGRLRGFTTGGHGIAGAPALSGSQATNVTDMQKIKAAMARITGLVGSPANVGSGGDAGKMSELLSYWPQAWSIYNPNLGQAASAYITTTDAVGNDIQPVIDQAGVNLSVGQLTQELGWENEYIGDLGTARGLAQTWHPRVETAIQSRRAQITKLKTAEANQVAQLRAANVAKVAKIKAKINANLKQIAAYNKQITSLNNRITAEQGKKRPNYSAIAGWKTQISGLQTKITKLQADNQKLGGATTYVGTGGEIASTQSSYGAEITAAQKQYDTDIAPLQSQVTTLGGYATALAAMPATISGVTGVGGLMGSAKQQQMTLGEELAQLDPGALQAALATADTSYASSSSTSSTLASLLETQNATLAEQLGVSQAQYNVLANMPPYAGVFHSGGVIPGPVGSEVMIRAQGGEIITPIGGTPPGGGGAGDVHVHLHGALGALEKMIDVGVERGTRKMASAAGRSRPGQRRGLIAGVR